METELIKKILEIGLLPAFLMVIVFLLVQDATRADKLKAVFLKPFFQLFKWFSKGYIESKINSNVNEFVNKEFIKQLAQGEKVNVKVKFVTEVNDPILTKNGSIIVRLKESNDQIRNILTTTQVVLPKILCPLIRNNIDEYASKAIDLTCLKKLANKLGKHGKLVFKQYFLDPVTSDDLKINHLIQELVQIDEKGYFISIFINELDYIGEGIYADSDKTNRTNEVLNFIKFLLDIANREIGEINDLEYLSDSFGISIILLARSFKASKQGVKPYLDRLNIQLRKGCESVYIVAFPIAYDFFDRFLNATKENNKIFLKDSFLIKNQKLTENFKVALYRKNDVFSDDSFESNIKSLNLVIGSIVEGKVIDVSNETALINVLGLNGYIKANNCSWYSHTICSDVLKTNNSYSFLIKNIDNSLGNIELSMRFPANDPWKKNIIPSIGDKKTVKVKYMNRNCLLAMYENELEIHIPIIELSWGELPENSLVGYIGQDFEVVITQIIEPDRIIKGSIRQNSQNPWLDIKMTYPEGKEITGKIICVNPQYLTVDIGNGLTGRIPKESMFQAGFEYKNFLDNVVVGQGIEVVVQKVFIGKQKISLELKRNVKRNK